jgi:hypothetical protein
MARFSTLPISPDVSSREEDLKLTHVGLEPLVRLDVEECAERLERLLAHLPRVALRVGDDARLVDELVEVDAGDEVVQRVGAALAALPWAGGHLAQVRLLARGLRCCLRRDLVELLVDRAQQCRVQVLEEARDVWG